MRPWFRHSPARTAHRHARRSRGLRENGEEPIGFTPIFGKKAGPYVGCSDHVDEGGSVDDQDLITRINELAQDEHELWGRESRGEASDAERDRLEALGVTLDQCWDLLHQRRARRAAGLDPDDASVRDASTVEGYLG